MPDVMDVSKFYVATLSFQTHHNPKQIGPCRTLVVMWASEGKASHVSRFQLVSMIFISVYIKIYLSLYIYKYIYYIYLCIYIYIIFFLSLYIYINIHLCIYEYYIIYIYLKIHTWYNICAILIPKKLILSYSFRTFNVF